MLGRWVGSLIVALTLVLGSAAYKSEESSWKAGVAKVNITPEHLMWMSGYAARTTPAEGKLHDLWAKALTLEDPVGRRAVLVTMDLVGIDRQLSRAVCAELKKRHGLPRESVMLAVSHTHCGPVVRGNLEAMYDLDQAQRKLVDDYSRALHGKLIGVVGEALAALATCRVSWGIGRAEFAVNRRNNKEADVPRLREAGQLRGPVDHELPVLSVCDPAGRLRAVVCGYACHATTLDFYLWSGDYPGAAQLALEKAHPGAIALFWAGCGGDQNPIPRRKVALVDEYGRQLADAVEAVLKETMKPVRGELETAYSEIDLPLASIPSREELVRDSASSNRYVAARARHCLEQIKRDGGLAATYPYPLELWRLGPDLTWIALGGEVVVDYSLRLKKELGLGRTWVAGYTNDVMAYIPSLRVLKEGGYEGGGAMVYYGLPTVWGPYIEELIVKGTKELAAKGTARRLGRDQRN
jgi:hypothetical protein